MQLLSVFLSWRWLRKGILTLAALCAAGLLPFAALAQGLIRDTEIEQILRTYSNPVFEAAGLNPGSIDIYIIGDDTINAFVMGGSNVFIHTGLILETRTPEMLIGVIAHETGHISGGHLIRMSQAMGKAQMQALLGYLLGAAAMVGGAGDMGAAVMTAGEHTALRNLFSHTRGQEQAADQAALGILDSLHISANGMLQMFEVLRKQERLHAGQPDPYTRTHPLSKDRIMHVRNHVEHSSLPKEDSVPPAYGEMHARMLGKLEGFIQEPRTVISRYAASDTSVKARYARAVAYFRMADLPHAVGEMDALIAQSPNDPYFHELKGQILFENGDIEGARAAYQRAVDLLPDAPLIRTELARSLLARENKQDLPQAISHLEYATSAEPENPSAWRLLATAYGRSGKMDLTHLSLVEEALALHKPEDAKRQMEIARQHIAEGSAAAIRAQDLEREIKKQEDEKENR